MMKSRAGKTVALVLGCILVLQVAAIAQTDAQAAIAAEQSDLPNAPSTVAQNQAPSPFADAPSSSPQVAPPSQSKDSAPTSTPAPSQEAAQPKGAAAAEVQPTIGTAASRPAGAAIAPAKQKRSRSFLIRMGAIAGIGVAVGTALALTSATPSKPPGAN